MTRDWYREDIAAAAAGLGADLRRGLEAGEAAARLKKHGDNQLAERRRDTLLQKLAGQFKDFLVLILLGASLFSLLIGELADAGVILAIVILNAILGVVQESKAEQALDALRKMAAPTSKAIRDGAVLAIPSRQLVPGDIVLLEAGDFVPADLRLSEAVNLKIDEASLTGESVPVDKTDAVLPADAVLAERRNMAYMGTTVTYGRGRGIVAATGMDTEIGTIARLLEDYDEEQTPLQKNLARFGRLLGGLCLAVCIVIFALGVYNGYRDGGLTFDAIRLLLMTAVSLAVAAIPEGLPAIVTVVLALGMQRMVKKNALVRKLHAVETLGSTTVICSDKTGTLTQNQMTVTGIYTAGRLFTVSGAGYDPQGAFLLAGRAVAPREDADLAMLLKGGLLASDARLRTQDDGVHAIVGDPTEGALVVAAAKGGFGRDDAVAAHPRLQEIPFDSDRKLMTTLHADGGKVIAFVKGAPDILLTKTVRILENGQEREMTAADAAAAAAATGEMAVQALRVLAVAYRTFAALPAEISPDAIERDLTFVGLLGMIDPPRPEARDAVGVCKAAGIRPVMITGDNPATALAVARELGITDAGGAVLTGSQLDALGGEELRATVKTVNVYARVSPANKVAIVDALRANGEIAAMTGDGVNDAPALKRADIGVAMGITGTDVTKGTADMVLTDDNFASIVAAVEEGRVIFANIRKCVFFLLSCNLAEIMIIFFAILFGWPIPLLPIHLLWLNLVTDAFPAFALGMENKEPDVMKIAPRDPRESIINRSLRLMIALQSTVMTVAVLGAFQYALKAGLELDAARTVAFATLILSELLRSLSTRSERYSLLAIGVFGNKYLNAGIAASFALLLLSLYSPLGAALKTVPAGANEWPIIAAFAVLPLFAGEAGKMFLAPGGRAREENQLPAGK
jgi:Ca2+-transporting ATPase